MIRRKQLPAKHLAIYLITMLVIMVLLPYFCIRLFPNLLDSGDKNRYDGELPKTVNLYLTKEDRYEKIPFETYMPVSYTHLDVYKRQGQSSWIQPLPVIYTAPVAGQQSMATNST